MNENELILTRLPLSSRRDSRKAKVSMKINRTNKAGFTLVEIMIVVAIIGLLAAIAIPNFVKARQNSQANACINNLRQLDGAVQQYALEAHKNPGATYTLANLAPYIKLMSSSNNAQVISGYYFPACPGGGTYAEGTSSLITNSPVCSLSVNFTPPHQL